MSIKNFLKIIFILPAIYFINFTYAEAHTDWSILHSPHEPISCVPESERNPAQKYDCKIDINKPSHVTECNICYSDSNFVSNCNHNYCIKCITKWIGEKNDTDIKCPYCQQDIDIRQCTYYAEIESDKLSSDKSSDRVIRNPDRAKIKLLD